MRKRRSSKGFTFPKGVHLDLPQHLQLEIAGLLLLGLGIITLLSLLSITSGALSDMWSGFLRRLFGWGAYLVAIGLGAGGLALLWRNIKGPMDVPWERIIALEIFAVAGLALVHLLSPIADPFQLAENGGGGGYVGWALGRLLSQAIGDVPAILILIAISFISLMAALGLSPRAAWEEVLAPVLRGRARESLSPPEEVSGRPFGPTQGKPSRPKSTIPQPPPPTKAEKKAPSPAPTKPEQVPVKPLPRSRAYHLPPLSLLNEPTVETTTRVDAEYQARVIEETLSSFGVPAKVVEINVGPTITQFGVEPGYVERRDSGGQLQHARVKVGAITALANDLALALSAAPIRIEAPVPGRPVVGIEVPNQKVSIVSLRTVMESAAFRRYDGKLKLALGQDVSGNAIVADLTAMPHLLIAGATGSGKSVCINAIIACLLCTHAPTDLKFLIVDPKRVELVNFNDIPHLLAPVIVEVDKVIRTLGWATREMDNRFHLFARAGTRNIDGYNRLLASRGEEKLPYIVIVIDELADLMMVSPVEVEKLVCRIAQLARATGIHLVIATQRPSVDVVTGLIKANFPARISFAVTSQIDSRVVLDTGGAEKLLGRGDMLYMASDSAKLVRLQGCFVSDAELARLIAFWQDRRHLYSPSAAPPQFSPTAEETRDQDELFEEAVELLRGYSRTSVSFLQRRLRIGYPRAARLMDLLEERGIVGPDEGGGRSREVLGKPRGSYNDDLDLRRRVHGKKGDADNDGT